MSSEIKQAQSQPLEKPEARDVGQSLRGFGYLYRRGRLWWLRYSHHGQDFRESSHSDDKSKAERLLKDRWKQIGRGKFIGPREERVRVNDLLDALVVDYQNNGRRSLNTLETRKGGRLKPLRETFGDCRAVDVTGADVERYKQDRLSEKTQRETPVSVATVNRELAALRRAYRLGVEQERIVTIPVIKLLAEHNVRQGFVEPPAFEAVAKHLPGPLNDVARFAYISGWRKNEVLTLQWSHVDRAARRVTLRREHSKNEEPRVLVLTGDLAAIIDRRWAARQYEAAGQPALSHYVFHRQGQRIVDFRSAWRRACGQAKRPGLLFHDLRRSAIMNLDRAGVSQIVAMKVTGHKTDSVYRRYRIVNEADIERALDQAQAVIHQAPPSNLTDLESVRRKAQT